jgi:hypothetical protein
MIRDAGAPVSGDRGIVFRAFGCKPTDDSEAKWEYRDRGDDLNRREPRDTQPTRDGLHIKLARTIRLRPKAQRRSCWLERVRRLVHRDQGGKNEESDYERYAATACQLRGRRHIRRYPEGSLFRGKPYLGE